MLNDYSGCCMISYLIDKEGYTFDHSNLPALWVEDMVKNFGVRYLVSTTREVDTREDLLPFYESLIYHKGFLRIYKTERPVKGMKLRQIYLFFIEFFSSQP
ncbi:MAG: hypothetical protein IPL23_18835 [Saprospiraceae bacterium]|nr:hypothetical protein [Saprospiraceae bacterium]